MSVDILIRKALDRGVSLELIEGEIRYKGNRLAVQELLGPLREHKADLLRWLSRPPANEPEPPPDPAAWRELAEEYHRHHFNCQRCIAAGRGARYGLRCGTGAALWTRYADSITR
ncbi:MAG: hypothetical protein K9K38_06620 [Rhodoferax sp.]|nr:hypothetical protein [Rhodoferax sp.]